MFIVDGQIHLWEKGTPSAHRVIGRGFKNQIGDTGLVSVVNTHDCVGAAQETFSRGPPMGLPSRRLGEGAFDRIGGINRPLPSFGGYGSGDDPLVEALTQVKRMAKAKRGRSTVAIDDHVGRRIRERRIMLGLTQQQLAEIIGVTYQQAHKYERGINRVSAGRLFEIARALSTPISYFYDGIGDEGPRQITLHQRMQLEIARNFAEIRNEKHQEAVSQLARALASR